MSQQTVKILTALVNHRSQADNLRARTNNYQELQLPILFKFCRYIFCLIFYFIIARLAALGGICTFRHSLHYILLQSRSVRRKYCLIHNCLYEYFSISWNFCLQLNTNFTRGGCADGLFILLDLFHFVSNQFVKGIHIIQCITN